MEAEQNGTAPRDLAAIGGSPDRQQGTWKHIGGSPSDDWNNRIAVETVAAARLESDERMREQQYQAIINGLIGIAPQNEMEGMMAAQLIAAHGLAMDCYRRAAESVHAYARREDLTLAYKLSRTFAALADTRHRHRGNGSQKITVEHVHVQRTDAPAGLVAAPPEGSDKNLKINPMQSPSPTPRRCGARTRRGTPCPTPAMPNGRCRMHGGRSPGAPKGNRRALKQGRYTAEAKARRRVIAALLRNMRALIRGHTLPGDDRDGRSE